MEKFRFRYKSEMIGTHGSLGGANISGGGKKRAPAVRVCVHIFLLQYTYPNTSQKAFQLFTTIFLR